MKTISLFSGCGGLDFGASKAGANIVLSNDIDANSSATNRKYFPDVEHFTGDIRLVKSFPEADLVVGGYPCQSFSMGGNRNPKNDPWSYLFKEYARCLSIVNPLFFLAENVSGLVKVEQGSFLQQQMSLFESCGKYGYRVRFQLIDAKEYGIPQSRKRLFLVGIRKDLGLDFVFPKKTHSNKDKTLKPFESHGEVIKHLPLWPNGEFYERPHDENGHMSWYYMSRNRKARWDDPSFTVVANWRHITLHPASPVMKLTWSDLKNGWKQRWDFSDEYEHILANKDRACLEVPRRLSWRECALIQTFPLGFEPEGNVQSKFEKIGNAVTPKLSEVLLRELISERGLVESRCKEDLACHGMSN